MIYIYIYIYLCDTTGLKYDRISLVISHSHPTPSVCTLCFVTLLIMRPGVLVPGGGISADQTHETIVLAGAPMAPVGIHIYIYISIIYISKCGKPGAPGSICQENS